MVNYIMSSFTVSKAQKRLGINPVHRRREIYEETTGSVNIKRIFEKDLELYEKLVEMAKYEERSMAAQVRWIVKQHIEWMEGIINV